MAWLIIVLHLLLPHDPPAAPARPQPHPSRSYARPAIPDVWARLVACEAPDRGWRYGAADIGTDPGYDFEGGPNFTHSTWLAYGGGRYAAHAYDASPAQQIVVARRVLADQGVQAWPVCGPQVGLARGD